MAGDCYNLENKNGAFGRHNFTEPQERPKVNHMIDLLFSYLLIFVKIIFAEYEAHAQFINTTNAYDGPR
ncbi:Uncharacterised protein [Yersinia frederiksenii]|nr:Uncharacterised protein [Yersinia frederiksenii]CNK18800.1 Uncharacterised protein [Yersinia frederiksenii]